MNAAQIEHHNFKNYKEKAKVRAHLRDLGDTFHTQTYLLPRPLPFLTPTKTTFHRSSQLELKSVFSQAVSSGSAGLHEMCKTKVSSLISFCIDETNWTGKKVRNRLPPFRSTFMKSLTLRLSLVTVPRFPKHLRPRSNKLPKNNLLKHQVNLRGGPHEHLLHVRGTHKHHHDGHTY